MTNTNLSEDARIMREHMEALPTFETVIATLGWTDERAKRALREIRRTGKVAA